MTENQNFYKTTKTDLFKIDPRSIKVVEGFNSRTDFGDIDELAKQIAEQGVLNPISVRKGENDTYELVDGERRYRAVMRLIEQGVEIARVPAIILPKSITKEQLLLQQIMRNEGKPFEEYEYGVAYKKLMDVNGLTIDEIANTVGKKRWHVDVCLSHLNRDEKVQELLKTNKISGAQVRLIYQAHHNEEEAVKEILKAAENHEKNVENGSAVAKNGKVRKISLSDLDGFESKVVLKRDSAQIKKGLNLLIKYYKQVTADAKVPIALNILDIVNKLNKDVDTSIIDILEDAKAKTLSGQQVG